MSKYLLQRESEISAEHITNDQAVRQTLLSRGIHPEHLLLRPSRLAGAKDQP